MIDLRDVTFTIPIRYDTDDRIRNCKATLSYLCRNVDTNIILYEDGPSPRFNSVLVDFPKCEYHFNKTNDEMFHRTKMLNKMAIWSRTPFIVNCDIDCLVNLSVYQDSVIKLRNNEFDIMTGFDSYTWNVPKMFHEKISRLGNIDWLKTDHCICANTADKAMGGIVWWQKSKFIECGMENENFVSWGSEDQERVVRAEKLGFRYTKIPGTLFHLDHARLKNSWMNHKMFHHNEEEFEKIKKMPSDELKDYVKTWPWIPKF